MKVAVVGAGKVGYHLTKELINLNKGYKVIVIDNRQKACERIANDMHVDTICGDGSSPAIINELPDDCDFFVAATGKDEVNFIACQLAKQSKTIKLSVARVNNPRNMEVAPLFNIDHSFCSTEIFVDFIENEIYLEGLRVIKKIPDSDYNIIEFKLSENAQACGKALKEYKFIKGAKIVAINPEDGNTFTPDGNTVMRGGDVIYMVCLSKTNADIWKEMVNP